MNAKKVGGLILLMAGTAMAMLALPPAARGGVPADATYLGSDLCRGCHGALPATAAAVKGWQDSAHPKAMWSVSSPPAGVQIVGDFSTSPPFPKEQVAYVLGVGTRGQAYLDKDYQVLPAQWDVKAKVWKPLQAVDGKTHCIRCHVTGFNTTDTTWKAMGVGCEMCHGPGSAHIAASDKKATIVNPMSLDPQKRAMVCGQCHSDGTSKDNVHPFPIGFKPGDDLDQVFTVSQSVPQGARNSQYNELRFGGGKHLAAGTMCTTCHDPHAGQGALMLRQTPPELCTQCHKNLTGAQHGEPVLKTVSCEKCHMPNETHTFKRPGA